MKAITTRRDNTEVFPAVPVGFNPVTREIEEFREEEPVTTSDGFVVKVKIDDEEPLFVSQDEETFMPNYSGENLNWYFVSQNCFIR